MGMGVVTDAARMLRYGGYRAEPKVSDDLIAEFDRVDEENRNLRLALLAIKNLVVGDKVPRWQDDYRTTIARAEIADACDIALMKD
jgi:hypothetical protein